jgi:hypothetical protein
MPDRVEVRVRVVGDRDVVVDEPEARMALQMGDVVRGPGEVVVEGDDLAPLLEQALAEM